MVIMTFYFIYTRELADATPLPYSWVFNLGGERTIATWCAGVGLFFSASLYCDHFLKRAYYTKPVRIGFLILAGLTVVLSADELGSLHERILWMIEVSSFGLKGVSIFILCVGGAGLALLTFALLQLAKDPEIRKLVYMPIVAFGLFVAVVLMEKLERVIADSGMDLSPFQSGIRMVSEEGSELIAVFLLILFAVRSARGPIFGGLVEALREIGSTTESRNRHQFLALSLGIAMICAMVAVAFNDSRGNLSEWFTAMCYFFVATMIFFDPQTKILPRSPQGAPSLARVIIVLLLLLISALTVAGSYRFAGGLKYVVVFPLFVLLFLFLLQRNLRELRPLIPYLWLPGVLFLLLVAIYVLTSMSFFIHLAESLLAIMMIVFGVALVRDSLRSAVQT